MKKLILYFALIGIIATAQSCSKDPDNYAEPAETLTGSVIDSTTGKPMQTETGSGGIRLRLDELSWSATPTPYYFYAKQDGTFNNTKIFKGTYRVSAEGPFVPMLQTTGGVNVFDKRVNLDIAGVATINFTVQPFLKLEWVGEPVVNCDGTISAKVKVSRGTANPAFQNDIIDLALFINSSSPYVGNNNYDDRYTARNSYTGTTGNAIVGQTITLTTRGGALPGKRQYFLRLGARTNYGLTQFNYTEGKTFTLP